MLGAAGALLCMALGTALGAGLKERRCARLRLLENEVELLARLRLMILEERLGLPALLRACAADGGEGLFARRRSAGGLSSGRFRPAAFSGKAGGKGRHGRAFRPIGNGHRRHAGTGGGQRHPKAAAPFG